MLSKTIAYMYENSAEIFELLLGHIELTLFSVVFAILVGVPVGILISYFRPATKPVMGIANVIQAIPSMALLGFAIPFLGIGTKPAICMVVLYSLLPIIKNTYTGLQSISADTLEAAKGIGMTSSQILFRIQLPMALPIIMAGVRISAVSAVGLMTLAAFVGADGLGYLVYAGIRTVNTAQILAGAIPSCILALVIDYIVSVIEQLVTPISLQKTNKGKKKRFYQKLVLLAAGAAVIIAMLFSHMGNTRSEQTITIGSMDFTEQEILSYMVKELVEANSDIHVEQKLSLGASGIVLDAMKSGDIDMYIDYTGTLYGSVLGYEPQRDVQKVYDIVCRDMKEQYDMHVLSPLNFSNTYTLAVRKDTAEKLKLKTISDLSKKADQLIFGPTLTFMERKDCMQSLRDTYGMQFKATVPVDGSPRYTALENKESDVIDAFSTDGLLKQFDLVVLEDDRHAFLPYQAVPVVNDTIKETYPQVEEQLKRLGEVLNEEVMISLNYEVDVEKKKAKEVAETFLKEQGLL